MYGVFFLWVCCSMIFPITNNLLASTSHLLSGLSVCMQSAVWGFSNGLFTHCFCPNNKVATHTYSKALKFIPPKAKVITFVFLRVKKTIQATESRCEITNSCRKHSLPNCIYFKIPQSRTQSVVFIEKCSMFTCSTRRVFP